MHEFPATVVEASAAKPVYMELDGWQEDISHVRKFEDLPKNAKRYVETIERIAGAPAKYIGVGPARDDIIIKR